jgi:DNA-binding transcriptional ArsR family regulator
MLDQIRRDIQNRLDELLAEADKLRRALAALASRDSTTSAKPAVQAAPPAAAAPRSRRSAGAAAAKPAPPRRRAAAPPQATEAEAAQSAAATPARARTSQVSTKAAVLSALGKGGAMTAGEIATATGLGRASISTTLSRLAKTGDVIKADRGYQIPSTAQTPAETAVAEAGAAAE